MTELLEQALTEVAKLPARAQDAIAASILQELASARDSAKGAVSRGDGSSRPADGQADAPRSEGNTILGLFADEPELLDEVVADAMLERRAGWREE